MVEHDPATSSQDSGSFILPELIRHPLGAIREMLGRVGAQLRMLDNEFTQRDREAARTYDRATVDQ